MKQKCKKYVAAMPEAARIFDSLEEHRPKLVNAIGSMGQVMIVPV